MKTLDPAWQALEARRNALKLKYGNKNGVSTAMSDEIQRNFQAFKVQANNNDSYSGVCYDYEAARRR